MGKLPDYEELVELIPRPRLPDDEKIPAVFQRDLQKQPNGDYRLKPGNTMAATRGVSTASPKRLRLRDQLATAWGSSGNQERALELAAYAVGGEISDIPEDAKESLATLTAWVFAMRAVGGSVEHFREIGDRVDPKPKRIEIEGAGGARRGGGGDNPEMAQAADDYYALMSGAVTVVDATFTKEEDDLSFLD